MGRHPKNHSRHQAKHLGWLSLRPCLRGSAVVLGILAVAACTYQPGYKSSPIERSFSWFSYLNGDGLRKDCHAGAPDSYRIVYNGVRDEQVRTYDLKALSGGGASLTIQVFQSQPDVSNIDLTDPLGPWRGKTVQRKIDAGQLAAIRDGLRESGFYDPPPDGTRVYSWDFFWLAAACEKGRFTYNAWARGTPRFAKVALRDPLMGVDTTGIKFNPPRKVELDRDKERERDYYELVITPTGISGQFTPF